MPGCPAIVRDGPRCPAHPYADQRTETAAQRGYDLKWSRISAQFLKAHPWCVGLPGDPCSAPAKVADHKTPRRILVARGEPHPDAWKWLQPLCQTHHNRKTQQERRTYGPGALDGAGG